MADAARIIIAKETGTIWVTHVIDAPYREEGPGIPGVSATNLQRDAARWPLAVANELVKLVQKRWPEAQVEEIEG